MSDEELLARIEKADENWQSITQGEPGDNTWGFFSYGDAPAAIGGGVGTFAWFPDRIEMLNFIASTLPFGGRADGYEDWREYVATIDAVVEGLKAERIDDQHGVAQLNDLLAGLFQIEWMGTVDDLLRGDHPYAVKVRSAYRREDDCADPGVPIEKDEHESFGEFLIDWGI